MKCIKHGEAIKRGDDQKAALLVAEGKATYCSREEWKQKVRGPVKQNPEKAIEGSKPKKAKKVKKAVKAVETVNA